MEPKPEVGAQVLDEYRRVLALLEQRRFDEALARGRLLLEQAPPGSVLEAKVHNLLCWTLAEGLKRPSTDAALHGDEAVRLSAALPDPGLLAESLVNVGSAYCALSELASAAEAYRRLQSLLAQHPEALVYGPLIAWLNLGHVAALAGEDSEALRCFAAAEALCTQGEHDFFRFDLWRRQAMVLLRSGQVAEAGRLLAQIDVVRLESRGYSHWTRLQFRLALCRLAMAGGDWALARGRLAGALALARELGDLAAMADASCMLAVMDYSGGRPEGWRRARLAINYAIASGRRDVLQEVRLRLRGFLEREGG